MDLIVLGSQMSRVMNICSQIHVVKQLMQPNYLLVLFQTVAFLMTIQSSLKPSEAHGV